MKGQAQWTGPEGVLTRDTVSCVHCSYLWAIDPSGPERSFCRRCYGPVCGRPGCVKQCLHWEKEMEQVEHSTPATAPLRCSHCHISWTPEKGSGRVRGICLKCNGHLCGARKCRTHPDRMGALRWLTDQIKVVAGGGD